jgi:hypothetical protein
MRAAQEDSKMADDPYTGIKQRGLTIDETEHLAEWLVQHGNEPAIYYGQYDDTESDELDVEEIVERWLATTPPDEVVDILAWSGTHTIRSTSEGN